MENEEIKDDIELNEKQPKKRGRKPKATRKGYFYEEEEDAFRQYVESEDQNFRDKIFREKLYPAFTKMVESLIRRYNLFTPNEEFEDTFNDTMSFLVTKMNNFKFDKGTKVYSYCGTIAKNYLYFKKDKGIKLDNNFLCYDDVYNDTNPDTRDNNYNSKNIEFNEGLIKMMVNIIDKVLSPDSGYQINENERKVGNALLDLLQNWEEIFNMSETRKFNKTSILYFIKENTMLNTKEIRDAMKRFKDIYFINKEQYIQEN